ncbi:MAG: radical SAM protein [Planctomycetes bacterium]|nr:radical SAM protein [Planctomycetota bacterium]
MPLSTRILQNLRPVLRGHPRIKGVLKKLDQRLGTLHHSAAGVFPALIRPAPRQITFAITARCNLLCQGCRYGRDFQLGEQLPLDLVLRTLDEARRAGVSMARFFGGEPLLHRDLPRMIEHATKLGMEVYITTNGTLLDRRIVELRDAGLKWMTIGFYGVGERYDEYTQRQGHFERLAHGLHAVREHCGPAFPVQLNFLLSRRTAKLEDLHAAWEFASRFGLYFNVDPISKVIPFFTDPEGELGFEPQDREQLAPVVRELLRLKSQHPERMPQSLELLRALPELLLQPGSLKVPCDAYQLLWVGADGGLQLCDSAFPLGNLHERPLSEILFGKEHRDAARAGFRLECCNCNCKIDSRIRRHAPTLKRYGRDWNDSSLSSAGEVRPS